MGEIWPTFNWSGKVPWLSEQFTKVVQVGISCLARFLLIELGMASIRWLEGLTLEIVFRRSDSEMVENEDQMWVALQGRISIELLGIVFVNELWMSFIFFSKKTTKLLQRSTEEVRVGAGFGSTAFFISSKRRFGLFFAVFTMDLMCEDLALQMWALYILLASCRLVNFRGVGDCLHILSSDLMCFLSMWRESEYQGLDGLSLSSLLFTGAQLSIRVSMQVLNCFVAALMSSVGVMELRSGRARLAMCATSRSEVSRNQIFSFFG